jgi:hypothetical protein
MTLDPIDRDPPEQHGERMVAQFEALALTIESALSDPELRRQIEANHDLLEKAIDTIFRIDLLIDKTPVLSAAE